MIELMTGVPHYVVAARASGKVTKQDFEAVLMPAFQHSSKVHGNIYLLLCIDSNVCDFTPGSWCKDFKTRVDHFTNWKKIAFVTDLPLTEKFSDLLSVLSPGSSKGYRKEELEEAKFWISQK